MSIITYRYEIETDPVSSRIYTATRALDARAGIIRLPCYPAEAEHRFGMSHEQALAWVARNLHDHDLALHVYVAREASSGPRVEVTPWIVKDTRTAQARYEEGTR